MLIAASAFASAGEELAEAARLIKAAQDEQAVVVLTRALDRGEVGERAQLYVLLGVARFNLRDEEGARLAFGKAIDADAQVSLPRLASPRVRTVFDEERAAWDKRRADAPKVAPLTPPPIPVVTTSPSGSTRRWIGLGVAIAGAAGAAVGGVLVGQSGSQRAQAVADPDALSAQATFKQAQGTRQLGWIVLGAGAAVAVAGGAFALWPAGETTTVAVGPGGVSVQGRF